MPNATVTVKDTATNVSRSTQTSAAGVCRVDALPASTFEVTVAAQEFKTTVQKNIVLEVKQIRAINLSLELGTTTTEVTITAAPPPIETSEARVSSQIGETRVRNLPLQRQNFYSLVVLTAGVTGLPSGAGGGQAYAQANADIYNSEFGITQNANGQRGDSNSYLVDSGSVNASPRGGFFINDDWKVKPNLTVSLGLRREYFGISYEQSACNNFSGIVFRGSSDFFSRISDAAVAKKSPLDSNDLNNFAPRLGKFLGGWQIGAATIAQSGQPFSVNCTASRGGGCDWNADGFNNDRPNQAAFGNFLPVTKQELLSADGIFNVPGGQGLSIFPATAVGTNGSLGRNPFIGPGYFATDMNLHKSTKIPWFWGTEGANLQFRAEMYNAFNQTNLTRPSGDVQSGSFGRSTTAFAPRNIQFGLKILFESPLYPRTPASRKSGCWGSFFPSPQEACMEGRDAHPSLSLPSKISKRGGNGRSGAHEWGFGRFNPETLSLAEHQNPRLSVVEDTFRQVSRFDDGSNQKGQGARRCFVNLGRRAVFNGSGERQALFDFVTAWGGSDTFLRAGRRGCWRQASLRRGASRPQARC